MQVVSLGYFLDKKLYFAGFGSALFILLPLFFWGGPDWVSPPVYQQVWNFGHIIFFALFGAFIQITLGVKNIQRWLLLSFLVLLIGIAIEYVQKQIGRSANWQDVFNDLAGFWLGLVWVRRNYFKPVIHWLTMILVLPAVLSILVASVVQGSQAWQFPLLAGFDNPIELQRVDGVGTLSNAFFQQGSGALKIQFTTKKYSGVYLTLFHGDWSVYRELAMEFYNPDAAPLLVTLRISDRHHDRGEGDYDDRFNRRLYLQPGWNPVRIPIDEIQKMPIDRLMDLDQVRTLGVYSSYLEAPRVLYWDHVRLE